MKSIGSGTNNEYLMVVGVVAAVVVKIVIEYLTVVVLSKCQEIY